MEHATLQTVFNQLLDSGVFPFFPKCCNIYQQTRPVQRFHQMRRFGNTAMFSALSSSDPQVKSSYIWGVAIVPIILGVFFFSWTVTTVVLLPCLGQKRVGFWAGAGFAVHKPDGDSNANVSPGPSHCTNCKANPQRPKYVRIFCFISLVILVISIFTLGVLGFRQLYVTTDTIVTATVETDFLLRDYSLSLQLLNNFTTSIQTAFQGAMTAAANECSIPTSAFSNFTQAARMAELDVMTFQETLDAWNTTNAKVQSTAITVMTYLPYLFLYWIPLLIITSFILLSLSLVWRWEYRFVKVLRVIKFVGMPLFFIWNVLSWVLLLCFLAGLVVNADACSGNGSHYAPVTPPAPLGTLLSFVYNFDPVNTSMVSELMMYYFGCLPGYFTQYYENYFATLVAGLILLDLTGSEFANLSQANSTLINAALSLANSTSTFNVTDVCSPEGVQTLSSSASAVQSSLFSTGAYLNALSSLLSCFYVSPIYNTLANEAVCTYNPNAMAWIFGSLAAVSASGLTAITLRSAFLPISVLPEDAVACSQLEGALPEVVNEGAPEVLQCTHKPNETSDIVQDPVNVLGDDISSPIGGDDSSELSDIVGNSRITVLPHPPETRDSSSTDNNVS